MSLLSFPIANLMQLNGRVSRALFVDDILVLALETGPILAVKDGTHQPLLVLASTKVLDLVSCGNSTIVSLCANNLLQHWDLADGGKCVASKSLPSNSSLTNLTSHSLSPWILAWGGSSSILLINPSKQLDVFATFSFSENWILDISLVATEQPGVDKLVALDADGIVHFKLVSISNNFNQSLALPTGTTSSPTTEPQSQPYSCTPSTLASFVHSKSLVVSSSFTNPLPFCKISWNKFEKTVYFIIVNGTLYVYDSIKARLIFSVPALPPTSDEANISIHPFIVNAIFLSAKTILVFHAAQQPATEDSNSSYECFCAVYFFGRTPEEGGVAVSHDLIREVKDDNSIVLVSDGTFAAHVAKFESGFFTSSESTTCPPILAKSESFYTVSAKDNMEPFVSIYCSSLGNTSPSTSVKSRAYFFGTNNSSIKFTEFWASLYASNVRGDISSNKNTFSGPSNLPLKLELQAAFENQTFCNFGPNSVDHLRKNVGHFTCLTTIEHSRVALGRADGCVFVVQTFAFLSGTWATPQAVSSSITPSDNHIVLKSCHNKTISCLHVPASRKSLLLGGSVHGCITLWDTTTGHALMNHFGHSQSVLSFSSSITEIPTGKLKQNCVISIGADNNVAIINLDEYSIPFIFYGHSGKPVQIYYRVLDDILMIQCDDSRLFVWQIKSGHLDRVVNNKDVSRDLLSSCIQPWEGPGAVDANIKSTLSASFLDGGIGAIQVNIKRLIDEIYNGQHVSTPTAVRKQAWNDKSSKLNAFDEDQSESSRPSAAPLHPTVDATIGSAKNPMDFLKQLKTQVNAVTASFPFAKNQKSRNNAADASGLDSNEDRRVSGPSSELVMAIFSQVFEFGIDKELDSKFQEIFGISNLRLQSLCMGIRGTGGSLSFPFRSGWVSPQYSAQRMLCLTALAKCTLFKGQPDEFHKIFKGYLTKLALAGIPDFEAPSLVYLLKYWHDPIQDVADSCKLVFDVTVNTMRSDIRESLVSNYKKTLPNSSSKVGTKTTIILALMGYFCPILLDIKTAKDVSTALEVIIRDESSPARILAVDIFGFGFSHWEPHVNSASMLRYLALLTGLGNPEAQQSAVAIMAKNAIHSIAASNTPLVVNALIFDVLHAKVLSERLAALKILASLVSKKPLDIYSYTPVLIDSMVKLLDPLQPFIRESLQDSITSIIAQLLPAFPNISFHSASQRLACVGLDGNASVYDLRTSAKSLSFSLSGPIHLCSFSPNGKLLAIAQLSTSVISIYESTPGIFKTLMAISAMAPTDVKPFRQFTVGGAQNISNSQALSSKFEWAGERGLKFFNGAEGGAVFQFTV